MPVDRLTGFIYAFVLTLQLSHHLAGRKNLGGAPVQREKVPDLNIFDMQSCRGLYIALPNLTSNRRDRHT